MSSHFTLARANMVSNQVAPGNVTDARLKDAMLGLPREFFVSSEQSGIAYIDAPIALGNNRYLADPSTFARLAQLANVKASDTVLDIGCGTGYSTAIFAQLAKKVMAVEPEEKLSSQANFILNQLGIRNAIIISEALLDGHPESGPYDVIFLNGAVEEIPVQLIEQLAENGRLIAVLKNQHFRLGEAVVVERHPGGTVTQLSAFGASLPGLIPNTSTAQRDPFLTQNSPL